MKIVRITKRILPIVVSSVVLLTSALGQDLETSKRAIDDFVKQAELKFASSRAGFLLKTKVKGRTLEEEFSYSTNRDDVEMLIVRYREGAADYEEYHYFQDRQLVYLIERQVPVDGGGPDWSGVYYFKSGILLDHTTNGHGKSEDDSWDPADEVLRMSRKRMKQLKDHLKRNF